MAGKMRKKVLLLSLIFAVIVYGVLLTYVFAISPIIKENSVKTWIQTEEAKKPKYKQKEVCGECHYEIYLELEKGNHSLLECEVCHGVGYKHTMYRSEESITIDTSREACLICHEDIKGRKAIHTVGIDHHAGIKCVVCHSPH